MDIRDLPSPNHDSRGGLSPSLVVLHYTGMASLDAAVERLRDRSSRVSCHYLIGRSGEVFRLVPEHRRAWHAGVAEWGGGRDVNARSIGVELDHPGHEAAAGGYGEVQMASLEALLGKVMGDWAIPAEGVVGHSDVAPTRKRDPGEWLDWRRLADGGLSVWPAVAGGRALREEDAGRLLRALAAFGYAATGRMDAASRAALRAWQRRFRPKEVGLWPCGGSLDQAEMLAERWPA